jgi:hypothetical protein
LRRIVAYGIDVVVVSVGLFAVAVLLSLLLGPAVVFDLGHPEPSDRFEVAAGRAWLHALLASVLSAAYFAGSWWRLGGTVAQRLLGMSVVSKSSGRRASLSAALVRWVVLIPPFGLASLALADIPSAGALLLILGAAWAVALLVSVRRRRDRRGIHDQASGTAVVVTATNPGVATAIAAPHR